MRYLGARRCALPESVYEVFSVSSSEADKVGVCTNAVCIRYNIRSNLTHVFECAVENTHADAVVGGRIWSEQGSPIECFERIGVKL